MRYLLPDEIALALRQGKSVEYFLGSSSSTNSIAWIELRPNQVGIELWHFEVEDVGDQQYTDVYTFPATGETADEPIATLSTCDQALSLAFTQFGAPSTRWLNQGVFHTLYAASKA